MTKTGCGKINKLLGDAIKAIYEAYDTNWDNEEVRENIACLSRMLKNKDVIRKLRNQRATNSYFRIINELNNTLYKKYDYKRIKNKTR